ncbi:hypothetical protein GCM10010277_78360 [Streptomyces longisporoflavus]|uniref:hypothetical protein n=1 Tax=Streptomyces longisporoflavus TaxID=28044 RepID=UPI00167DE838|nr:hypothetical protein [Streptomyces longisporoflavus]GGV68767.1 hypothetical protein GCM10010277_78360 [Streptomyces longisporoflavus]
MKSVRAFVVAVLCLLAAGTTAGTAAAETSGVAGAGATARASSPVLLDGDSGWG